MKLNKLHAGSYLTAFLRVFISYNVMGLLGLFIVSLFTGYQIRIAPPSLIIYQALGFSIIYSFAFVIKTHAISIANKDDFIVILKKVLNKKKYKIASEENYKIIVKPSWFFRLFTTDILIEVCNTEVKLTGAVLLVRDIKNGYEAVS